MRKTKAARLRFAILTARDRLEPERITQHQRAFIEACHRAGLMIGDRWTTKAHDKEYRAAWERWLKWNQ